MLKTRILRIGALVLGLCSVSAGWAQSQVWEKLVAPGLTYRMEIDLALPRVIHALRYTPGVESVSARPETAKDKIMIVEDANKGRDLLSSTVKNKGAIAGINADFFPWTGDPVGAMVRHGELLSSPFVERAIFAWGSGYSYIGSMDLSGAIVQGDVSIPVSAVNQELGDNEIGITTEAGGVALSKVSATHVIVETESKLIPNGVLKGTVKIFSPDNTNQVVEKGQVVVSATGNKRALVTKLQRGEEVQIKLTSKRVDWSKAVHAIGGGPLLINDGKIKINGQAEKFAADFATSLHPRSAVGVTKDGDIWLLVVDGRQGMSRGCGLDELARVMQRLGCRSAMNLDGGGSSTLNIAGLTMNRPSGGTERAIANSILLFGNLPEAEPTDMYVIKGVPRLKKGEVANYSLVGKDGETILAKDVFWAAQGAAWIDQAGVLRTSAAGKCTISARVKNMIVTAEVIVEDAPPPGKPGTKGSL